MSVLVGLRLSSLTELGRCVGLSTALFAKDNPLVRAGHACDGCNAALAFYH